MLALLLGDRTPFALVDFFSGALGGGRSEPVAEV
jgi:hypothetical protein